MVHSRYLGLVMNPHQQEEELAKLELSLDISLSLSLSVSLSLLTRSLPTGKSPPVSRAPRLLIAPTAMPNSLNSPSSPTLSRPCFT